MSSEKDRFNELNQKRAEVIEEVMRLRHEQARLKAELVKVANELSEPNLIAAVIRCW